MKENFEAFGYKITTEELTKREGERYLIEVEKGDYDNDLFLTFVVIGKMKGKPTIYTEERVDVYGCIKGYHPRQNLNGRKRHTTEYVKDAVRIICNKKSQINKEKSIEVKEKVREGEKPWWLGVIRTN